MNASGQPSYTELAGLIHNVDMWLIAAGILMARPMAVIAISPVFSRAELTPFLRSALCLVLILPMLPTVAFMVQAHEMAPIDIMILAIKEVLIGTLLGLPLSLPFWALTVAGDLLDLHRGATQSQLANPDGAEESVTSALLVLAGVMVFVVAGGLEAMTNAIYSSWDVWKPLALLPMPDARLPSLILGLLDSIFRRGFELSLPPMIVMLLADAAMIIIIRMTPQIHLDDVTLAARNLAFVVFMPLYAGYLLHYTGQDDAVMNSVMNMLEPVFAAAPSSGAPPMPRGVAVPGFIP